MMTLGLPPTSGIRSGLQAPAAEVPQDECRPVDAPRRESSRTKGPDQGLLKAPEDEKISPEGAGGHTHEAPRRLSGFMPGVGQGLMGSF